MNVLVDEWEALHPPAEFISNSPPRIQTESVDICPVCADENFAMYALGFDYESQTCSNPWRFVQCPTCSHVRLHPRPAAGTLPIIYPPTYYSYRYDEVVGTVGVRSKIILDQFKLRAILRHLPELPHTSLDIGCGDGRFLRVVEKQGLPRNRLYGLELDESVTDSLCVEGYRVFCNRVEDKSDDIPAGKMDLVTMFHVLEHVGDINRVIGNIFNWMSPGGVLAIETPNIQSLDARIFKRGYWGGYHIPRHWNLFTPSSLEKLLSNHGLEVVSTQYQTGHGLWMYSFHHHLRYGSRPRHRLAKAFDPFLNIPFTAVFVGLDMLRARLGCKTSAMLMLARKP